MDLSRPLSLAAHRCLGLDQFGPKRLSPLPELQQRVDLPGDQTEQRVVRHQLDDVAMRVDVGDREAATLQATVDTIERSVVPLVVKPVERSVKLLWRWWHRTGCRADEVLHVNSSSGSRWIPASSVPTAPALVKRLIGGVPEPPWPSCGGVTVAQASVLSPAFA